MTLRQINIWLCQKCTYIKRISNKPYVDSFPTCLIFRYFFQSYKCCHIDLLFRSKFCLSLSDLFTSSIYTGTTCLSRCVSLQCVYTLIPFSYQCLTRVIWIKRRVIYCSCMCLQRNAINNKKGAFSLSLSHLLQK